MEAEEDKEKEEEEARKTLGRVTRTLRGFELIEFRDHNGHACSLQASSIILAEYVKPGTSAVWLGREENAAPHPITGEVLSPRMHLDRRQVAALISHLQCWLDADTFCPEADDVGFE